MADGGFYDAERDRRIGNLVREGTIYAIDGGAARVQLTEDLITDFLPVRQWNAGRITSWSPMKLGEQVSVLSASGETSVGTVLRGLPCTAIPLPSTDPDTVIFAAGDDGVSDSYNLATHAWATLIPAGGQLLIKVGATTEILVTDGQVTIQGAAVALGPDGDRQPVARVGDQVQVGSAIGHIITGSPAVMSS